MSMLPEITKEGYVDESNERALKLRRTFGTHDGLPVTQSLRGERSKEVAFGEVKVLPVRITESIERERIEYKSAVGKLLGWGGEKTKDVEYLGVIDDGTVVHGNERIVDMIENTLQPRPERLGPSSLLIAKKSDDVRADLFSMRHELRLPVDVRTIDGVRRAYAEDIHPGLPYRILPDGVPAGFAYDGKTGVDAAEAYLETEVKVREIWKRLCALVDRKTALPSFDMYLDTDEEEMGSAICGVVDIHFESKGGRRKATSFSSTPMRGLSLSLNNHRNDLEEFECTLVHELAHMLTNGLPHCEMLREGMAEAIVALYGETYDRPYVRTKGTPSMRPASPGASVAQRTPTCAKTIERLHTVVGWGGASMFLDVLGNTTEERLGNLRHLVAASAETSNDESGTKVAFIREDGTTGSDTVRKLPTVDEWIGNVDRARPGLGRAIQSHPVMQPIGPRGIAAFYPHGTDGPWGTITAFAFEPNESFGYAKPDAPYLSTRKHDYDWGAGTATPTTVDIRVTAANGKQYAHRDRGIVSLTPPTLCIEMKIPLKAFDDGVTVEYRVGENEWTCAGKNVTLKESDARAYYAWKRFRKKDSKKFMEKLIRDVEEKGLSAVLDEQKNAVLNPPKTASETEDDTEGGNENHLPEDSIFAQPSGLAELTKAHGGEVDDFFTSYSSDALTIAEDDQGKL